MLTLCLELTRSYYIDSSSILGWVQGDLTVNKTDVAL